MLKYNNVHIDMLDVKYMFKVNVLVHAGVKARSHVGALTRWRVLVGYRHIGACGVCLHV